MEDDGDREGEEKRPKWSARLQESKSPATPSLIPQTLAAPDGRTQVPARVLPVGQPEQLTEAAGEAHSATIKSTPFNQEPCTLSDYWERALDHHEGIGYGTTVTRYDQFQELKRLVAAPPKRLSDSASRAKKRADEAQAQILSHIPGDDDQRVVVFAAALDSHDQGVPLTCVHIDETAEFRAAVDSGTIVTITNIHPSQLERFDVSGRKLIKCFDGNVTASLGEGVIVGSMINRDNVPIIAKAQYVSVSLTAAANGPVEVESVPESVDMSSQMAADPVPSQSPLASNPCADAHEEPNVEELYVPHSEAALSNGCLHDELSTEDISTRRNLSGQELAFDQRLIKKLVRDQNIKVDIDEEARHECTSCALCKIIMLAGGIIHWQSKLQSVTALSTAEAETYASIEVVKTLVHLRLLLRELGLSQKEPTVVYEDNAAAISLATGTEQSKRARHYQMKVAWICEHYDRGTFVYGKVTTKQQLADIFTKALPRDDFERYRNWMGILSPHDLKYDGYESSV